jgi:glycosyltransferase involved in cell wall biosynthesis
MVPETPKLSGDKRGLPRISVVIPTLGRSSLRAAVDSICRQSVSRDAIEIVVVNDSPDQLSVTAALGVDVVEEFTGGGKGPSAARNRGVDRARGDLIAYLDDDDWWFPHHIASALRSFEETPALDLYASTMFQAHPSKLEQDSRVVYRGGRDLVDFFYGRFCWADRRRSIPPSTWVIRRDRCDLRMDETVRHHEDMWWLLNQDKRNTVVRQSPNPGGVKFEHPAGSDGSYVARWTVEEIVNWAERVESLRFGAGQRFAIGIVGRSFARRGMRQEWLELIDAIPPEWRITWDYQLVRAVENVAIRTQRNRAQRQ